MPDQISHLSSSWRTRRATASLALSMLVATSCAGWPQGAPQPSLGVQAPAPPQVEPPAHEAPAQPENPGLINEIGKLFEKSKSMLPPLKSTGEAIDDFNARAR